MSENPYQAPLTEVVIQTAEIGAPRELNIGWVFGRWFLICFVAAAPSFVIAFGMLKGSELPQVTGMICGILAFVIGYTLVETRPLVQSRLARDSALRLAAKIAYGTRIGISILFPIGIYLDIVVGIFAVGISEWISNVLPTGPFTFTSLGENGDGFAGFFVTTIIQGGLLNIVLFGYLLIVYGIIRIVNSVRS